MSELTTEADAEDVLLSAVLGSDTGGAAKLDNGENIDAVADETADDEPKVKGEEEEEAPEAKQAKPQEEEAPEEDEIEIEGEEGKEPTRLKLKDVVADYQEFQKFKGQQTQVIEQVEREAVERVTGGLRQVEQVGQQMGFMVQAALQLLQAPQPPNADAMLNPASPQYDPDGYHRLFAQYQRAHQQHGLAQQLGEKLMNDAKAASAQATEARETRELQRLQRAWPEFGEEATLNQFVSDMGKAYGFSRDELDAVLTDHRQALVARDALAFRAMKAQSGTVKAKVEAKAPKIVRTKQEAKGGSAQARDDKGQFRAGALAELKRTNSDAAAEAYFVGLAKEGRI